MKWRIFYADGTTFGSEKGEPKDAPGLGVVVIVQENETPGERPYLQHRTDYYIWRGNRWLGCDLFGLWQYLFVEKFTFEKAFLAGQTVENWFFDKLHREAKKVRDSWYG